MKGQISFDFCLDTRTYVCQANTLVSSKQALKLNNAKIIRAVIMQVVEEDEELKPYTYNTQKLIDWGYVQMERRKIGV